LAKIKDTGSGYRIRILVTGFARRPRAAEALAEAQAQRRRVTGEYASSIIIVIVIDSERKTVN
jgi:hypothetical protein